MPHGAPHTERLEMSVCASLSSVTTAPPPLRTTWIRPVRSSTNRPGSSPRARETIPSPRLAVKIVNGIDNFHRTWILTPWSFVLWNRTCGPWRGGTRLLQCLGLDSQGRRHSAVRSSPRRRTSLWKIQIRANLRRRTLGVSFRNTHEEQFWMKCNEHQNSRRTYKASSMNAESLDFLS